MYLNRLLLSLHILASASSIPGSTISSTSETACRRLCNDAVKEAESTGQIPKLCEIDSMFSTKLAKCQNCNLATDVRMNSTKQNNNLQSYIEYCASLNSASAQNIQALSQRSNTLEISSIQATVLSLPLTTTTTTPFNRSLVPSGASERFIKETPDPTALHEQNASGNTADNQKLGRRWEIAAFAIPVGLVFGTAIWIILRSRYSKDRFQPKIRSQVINRHSTAGKPELPSQNWTRFELGTTLRRVPELLGILKPISELHSVEDQIFELSPEEKRVFELPAIEPACLELPTYFETANPSDLVLIHATHLRV